MSEAVSVFVGGIPLSSLAEYHALSWTTRWPGGDFDASWTLRIPHGWRHRAMTRGNRVEIRYGGLSVWLGYLSEFDRESGQVAAEGLIRRAEDYDAMVWNGTTSKFDATWKPASAVDDAISPSGPSGRVAIGWTRDTSVPTLNLNYATQSTDVVRLDALLAMARERGFGTENIGPDGVLKFTADPTTPSWHVRPKVVRLNEAAGDERATHILVDYMSSSALSWLSTTTYSVGNIVTFNGDLWKRLTAGTGDIPEEGSIHWAQLDVETWDPGVTSKTYSTGTYYALKDNTFYQLVVGAGPDATVSNPPTGWTTLGTLPTPATLRVQDTTITPYREKRVNALGLGDLPTSEATTIANAALAAALAPSFTTDIPVTGLTVTDARMQPVNPITLRAGTLGRIWGAAHPRLAQGFTDVIAGEVTVSNAETDTPTAVIKPLGKQPQSDEEVMEATLNARRSA